MLNTATNGEKGTLDGRSTSFHKGLPHDACGLPDLKAYGAFLKALEGAEYQTAEHAGFDVPLGPTDAAGAWEGTARNDAFAAVKTFSSVIADAAGGTKAPSVRNWESPLAGHQFDLEGPTRATSRWRRRPGSGAAS